MQKVCLRHNKADFLRLIRLSREIIDGLSQPFQNLCPFSCFQRHTIRAIEASGDKTNSMAGELWRTLNVIHELSFHSWNARSMKICTTRQVLPYVFLRKPEK